MTGDLSRPFRPKCQLNTWGNRQPSSSEWSPTFQLLPSSEAPKPLIPASLFLSMGSRRGQPSIPSARQTHLLVRISRFFIYQAMNWHFSPRSDSRALYSLIKLRDLLTLLFNGSQSRLSGHSCQELGSRGKLSEQVGSSCTNLCARTPPLPLSQACFDSSEPGPTRRTSASLLSLFTSFAPAQRSPQGEGRNNQALSCSGPCVRASWNKYYLPGRGTGWETARGVKGWGG